MTTPRQLPFDDVIRLVERTLDSNAVLMDWLQVQKQLAANSDNEIAALKARVAQLEKQGTRVLPD